MVDRAKQTFNKKNRIDPDDKILAAPALPSGTILSSSRLHSNGVRILPRIRQEMVQKDWRDPPQLQTGFEGALLQWMRDQIKASRAICVRMVSNRHRKIR